ncbi:MAG: hypothetical protein HXX11_07105 [Desulfuromonadales bacterium]|nr:hypothetical protein [Desulfuromonadales bacterium]
MLPVKRPPKVTFEIREETKEGYEMHIERRDHLKGLNCGESVITVSVASLFGDMLDCISRKSKVLLCLAHVCMGSSLIVYGFGLTGISQIVAIVLGFVMAVPFVEKLVWLVINAFCRKA